MAKKYSEKLKDPRWQKIRLKVLERDGWACRKCLADDRTLHVHHLYYVSGKEPWEYDLDALMTLCEECHQDEYEYRREAEDKLLEVCRILKLWADEVDTLACDLFAAGHAEQPRALFEALSWAMRAGEGQRAVMAAFEHRRRAGGEANPEADPK